DRLEALVVAVGPERPEPLDRSVHGPRVEIAHGRVAEPQAIHDPGAEVLGHDVGLADQAPGDLLALTRLEVDDHAPLVRVQEKEEVAIEIGSVVEPEPASPVPVGWALDLDHVSAEPGQHLRARRASLIVGEVDDADPVQCLAHAALPSAPLVTCLVLGPSAACRTLTDL